MTLHQAFAICLAFLAAFMFHRWVKSFIVAAEATIQTRGLKPVLRTTKSISLPIAWVIGLWIALAILMAFGETTGLVNLFASLLNAWVLIRIVSTLIFNPTASNLFAWTAWIIAALNAIGQLDPFIRWMDGIRIENDAIRVSMWDVVQGLVVTGVLLWVAFAVSAQVHARLEKSAKLNPSMQVLVSKLLRIALIILAVVLGMQSVGIDLTAFAVFSGALGLGVGLGMQRTVGNLTACLRLL